mgnify:CR=1 FL=1
MSAQFRLRQGFGGQVDRLGVVARVSLVGTRPYFISILNVLAYSLGIVLGDAMINPSSQS